jgi:tetratricopeptide (TPR) repeat protein
MSQAGFRLPYATIVDNAVRGSFAVDFYGDLRDAAFPEQFAEAWRQLSRRAPSRPRSSLFVFVLCQGCGLPVMTNRDPGTAFGCRACGTEVPVRAVAAAELDAVLEAAMTASGRQLVGIGGQHQVVLIQCADLEAWSAIEATCEECQFERAPDGQLAAAMLLHESVERGQLEGKQPFVVWQRRASPGARGFAGEPTPDVEELLGALHPIGSLRTASLTYDPAGNELGMVMAGGSSATEAWARARLATDPANADVLRILITSLIEQERLVEAKTVALTAVGLQPGAAPPLRTLGLVELELGDLGAAARHLEDAITIDPVDRLTLTALVECHHRLGDDGRAAKYYSQLQALGGLF